MSERTKKHHTDKIVIEIGNHKKRLFNVPKAKAQGILKLIEDYEIEESIDWKELYKDEIHKHGEAGLALKDCRTSHEMTQNDLAKKLEIPQSNIAAIESGKRPITKKMAQRLAKVFKTDYRIFLDL